MKRAYMGSQYAKPYERYCRELYPDEAERIFVKAEEHYLEFLKDMPDLGENMMAKNMLDWFTIISFYEASGRRLDGEALLEIKRRMTDKMKFLGRFVDGNRQKWPYRLFEKTYVKFIKMQKEHQSRGEWMDSWKVELNPEHRTEGFAFHLVGCPKARERARLRGAVAAMEKKSALIANDTQKSQTALIEAVLETIQGMSVIKSFNLTGKGDKKLQEALEYNRRSNIDVTNILTPYTALQEAVLQIAGVGMMLAAILLWIGGSMSIANALMVLVMSFLVFNQIKAFGMGVSMLRMAAAAIDRTIETEDMPRIDENGKALAPEKHDIVFDHVNFSYEQKPILHDISVTLPDKTTTAVIGPSGSGKTTFCNLIARFWDTDSGSVSPLREPC